MGEEGGERLGAGERLVLGRAAHTGLSAHLVDGRGDIAVGVADDPHHGDADVLGERVRKLVDVPCGEAELRLDVLEGRASANPELAVARVREELFGVAAREWPGVDDALVAAALSLGTRVHDEHGVRLAVCAEPAQVGKGRVRPEGVVAVVGPHLEPARGDDKTLTRVCRAESVAARGGIRGDLRASRPLAGARCPAFADERAELVRGGSGAVLGLLLGFAAHPAIVPRVSLCACRMVAR